MATKLSKTQYFVFICLFTGIVGSVIQQEFWSTRALAETSLIIFSLSYLVSKYYSSKTIHKYQDYGYKPDKKKRVLDDIIVETSFHVVMPVSLSLLYACVILFILKYLPLPAYKTVGTFVNPIIDFNKQYLKYPVVLLGIILAILTLTRYLSVKKYKSFQKVFKYISAPVKVAVILTFFLAQDKGISNNILEYRFNSNPVVSDFVTLNSSPDKSESDKKNKLLEEALTEYVKYVIERLNNNYGSATIEDTFSIPIKLDAIKLNAFVKQFPQIENKVSSELLQIPNYNVGDKGRTFSELHQTVWSYPNQSSKGSNLYKQAQKKESSFFSDFVSIISDERKSISKKVLSEDAEIIQKLIGDFTDILPLEKLTNWIPLHKLLKDKVVNRLKDKLVNSFYSLITKPKISRSDIVQLNSYIDNVLTGNYQVAIRSVRKKIGILNDYYAELNKAATKSYFEVLTKTPDRSIITYEEGLQKKKEFLELERNKFLNDAYEKNQILDEWETKRPDLSREELESELKQRIDKYYDERVSEIDKVMSQKENLKDYNFIRDRFSAGGIFFGQSIQLQAKDIFSCPGSFYPEIQNCPQSILYGNLRSVTLKEDQLIIALGNRKYVSTFKVSRNLLLAAYNYVYAQETYPVLIDGFYDNNNQEFFAYNKNITYDQDFLKTLLLSDEFIFEVLEKHITSSSLDSLFGDSKSAFEILRSKVSLSRIFDESHLLTGTANFGFSINSGLKFSVVSKNKVTNTSGALYSELGAISGSFNASYSWLLNNYDYLSNLGTFASYQALFRSLPQERVDISELILKK